jgi:hypothetical protein
LIRAFLATVPSLALVGAVHAQCIECGVQPEIVSAGGSVPHPLVAVYTLMNLPAAPSNSGSTPSFISPTAVNPSTSGELGLANVIAAGGNLSNLQLVTATLTAGMSWKIEARKASPSGSS